MKIKRGEYNRHELHSCNYCGETFRTVENYDKHIKRCVKNPDFRLK